MSQSLPNQVNDFNKWLQPHWYGLAEAVAIPSKPGQRLQCGYCSPRSIHPNVAIPSKPGQRLQLERWDGGSQEERRCRNPFQTRSTSSIGQPATGQPWTRHVAIPSKPGQRLQCDECVRGLAKIFVSQSLPNQVNDFNRIWPPRFICHV